MPDPDRPAALPTSRERVRAAVHFEPPDRLPRNDSPWRQTLERWRLEGLPEGVELADHFGFDIATMYLDLSPRFEMRVLERDGVYYTYVDRYGYTLRKEEHGESTIDFIGFCVDGRDAWEQLVAPRLRLSDDPDEPARLDDASYFGHFDPYPSWDGALERYHRQRATGRYQLFMFYGPWEALWRMRGMAALLVDLLDDPEWVEEMAARHVDLAITTLRRCLELGACPDGILWAEDLGCNSGPLFSPKSWASIFRPHYARLGEFLHASGVDFWMHSDGQIDRFLEPLIEVGVQVLNPLEVKAGMDAVELRQRLGKNLAFYGNLSAQAMAGPREALEAELQRKVPLARGGGFILHSDHSVPPEVSFESFTWLQRRAQEIFEGR